MPGVFRYTEAFVMHSAMVRKVLVPVALFAFIGLSAGMIPGCAFGSRRETRYIKSDGTQSGGWFWFQETFIDQWALQDKADCGKDAKYDHQFSSSKSDLARLQFSSQGATPGHIWVLSDMPPETAPAADDAVFAVDPNTLQNVATILLPGPIPGTIAVSNSGARVYVTVPECGVGCSDVAPAHAPLVEAISTSTLSIVQTITLPSGVTAGEPALSADDRYLYLPVTVQAQSGNQGQVWVIDTQNPSATIAKIGLTSTTRSGTSAAGSATVAAITPDGQTLFTVCDYGVCAVDTTTKQQTAFVGYGAGFDAAIGGMAIDPTGSRLFLQGQTHVYVYDTATLSQVGVVAPKSSDPKLSLTSIQMSPDGFTVYVNDLNSATAFYGINAITLTATEIDAPTPAPDPNGEPYYSPFLLVLP